MTSSSAATRWLTTVVENNRVIYLPLVPSDLICSSLWNQICTCFYEVCEIKKHVASKPLATEYSSRNDTRVKKTPTYWNPNCACDCYCLGMAPRQAIQPHARSLFTQYDAVYYESKTVEPFCHSTIPRIGHWANYWCDRSYYPWVI